MTDKIGPATKRPGAKESGRLSGLTKSKVSDDPFGCFGLVVGKEVALYGAGSWLGWTDSLVF